MHLPPLLLFHFCFGLFLLPPELVLLVSELLLKFNPRTVHLVLHLFHELLIVHLSHLLLLLLHLLYHGDLLLLEPLHLFFDLLVLGLLLQLQLLLHLLQLLLHLLIVLLVSSSRRERSQLLLVRLLHRVVPVYHLLWIHQGVRVDEVMVGADKDAITVEELPGLDQVLPVHRSLILAVIFFVRVDHALSGIAVIDDVGVINHNPGASQQDSDFPSSRVFLTNVVTTLLHQALNFAGHYRISINVLEVRYFLHQAVLLLAFCSLSLLSL